MRRFFVLFIVFIAFVSSINSFSAVPLRHVLLSTNDLNDLGFSPLEGEILYDMVTGCIVAHLNGQDIYLPTVVKKKSPVRNPNESNDVFSLGSPEMRAILFPITNINSPVEGEIGHDLVNNRIAIFRGGSWEPLGHRAPVFENSERVLTSAMFRHILPDVSTITMEEGELAADFAQNTVWFMTNGVKVDLRTPPVMEASRPIGSSFFSIGELK